MRDRQKIRNTLCCYQSIQTMKTLICVLNVHNKMKKQTL
ncbi:hypothetical protein BSMD_000380 [Bacillus subtilis Miyagi-4]|nr:hypothetical protein BSMD_000380 [Bacillus subtilis Miyagi-4]